MSIKTNTELRDELLKIVEGLRDGTVDIELAKQLSNAAGKVIRSAKLQLEYNLSREEKPEIDFIK